MNWKQKIIFAGCILFLLGVFLHFVFSFLEMPDASMEPDIRGRDVSAAKNGDYVLALNWFRGSQVKTGDFVVIKIPDSSPLVRTVRKVERIEIPDSPFTTPVRRGRRYGARLLAREIQNMDYGPRFYLSAGTNSSANGFGPFQANQIDAKVIHIYHRNK
jgi:signal peptidase I